MSNAETANQVAREVLAVFADANPNWVYEQAMLQLAIDPVPLHAQARILDSALNYGYVKAEQPPNHAANLPAPAAGPSVVQKRKAPNQDPGASKHIPKKQIVSPRFDYTKLDRPLKLLHNPWYCELSLKYLFAKFDKLPVHYIRQRFNQTRRLVPAYMTLHAELTAGTARCLKKARHSVGPYETPGNTSSLFVAERKALDAFIASGGADMAILRSASPPPADRVAVAAGPPVAGPSGLNRSVPHPRPVAASAPMVHAPRPPIHRPAHPAGIPERRVAKPIEKTEIECGCCFGDTDITEMVQCAEGHLFCTGCAKQHAETAVGDRKHEILCMDQSGCRVPFPDDQLRRVLPANTLDLLDRLRQAKDLEAAQIGGLEHCPFCDFACIIVDEGRTFRCQKPSCMVESCRKCRRKDHAPKSCEEMDQEEKSSKGEHEVAEAMTRALVRDCPKCKAPFMKEAGCNKMTCPKCQTISCYICRKEISKISPYTHFDQQPDAYHLAPAKGRCRLWDIDRAGRAGGSPTRAHNEEISRAEREARARLEAAASGSKIKAPQFQRA